MCCFTFSLGCTVSPRSTVYRGFWALLSCWNFGELGVDLPRGQPLRWRHGERDRVYM